MTLNEFKQVDLRIARILRADKIENSEKLLKLEINLGSEKKILVAGIAKNYQPENLVGKEIVIVYNLEEREILGVKSQGMLLAASTEAGPVILMPEKEVLPGTEVK